MFFKYLRDKLGGDRANPDVFYLVLPGDYNSDALIDAADFVVWRENGDTLEAYAIWRASYRRSSTGPTSPATNVPEPATAAIMLTSIATLLLLRQKLDL